MTTPLKNKTIKHRLLLQKQKKEALDIIRSKKEEIKRRKREESIRYYVVKPDGTISPPHPNQDKFHRDKSLRRVVLGGRRSGKSESGIREDVAHSLGYRPWLEEGDADRTIDIPIPNKGLIIGEKFEEQVKNVLVPKLLGNPAMGIPGAIPLSEIDPKRPPKKNSRGVVVDIFFRNGSTIHLQSYDQGMDAFQSADYHWAHPDEPPPRPIWVAIKGCLTDHNGRIWVTMTPLKEPYFYDEVVCRTGTAVFEYDIEDNLNYGLTRQGIDEYSSTLTDEEKPTLLKGKYHHLAGLVYKSYSKIHRIKRVPVKKHWNLHMHIDTHRRTPHHAIWIAILPDNKKYVVGELKNIDPHNRVEPFVESIITYEREVLGRDHNDRDIDRLIEPAASEHNPIGPTILEVFNKCGIWGNPGIKNPGAGITLLNEELKYNPEVGTYPNIYFFDDLQGVHFEMTHYIWEDWSRKSGWTKTEKQVPRDKDDHFVEGIHRVLLNRPRYINKNSSLFSSGFGMENRSPQSWMSA
jgi:phage terminase large subunit-like protein